jgi:hypothetical protein
MTIDKLRKNHLEAKIAVTSISFGKSDVLRKELLQSFPNSIFNENGQQLFGTDCNSSFLRTLDFPKEIDVTAILASK